MRNLLYNPPDEAELCALLEATHGAVLPLLGAREWALAARRAPVASWLDGLRRRAKQDVFRPLPRLTDDLYSEFHHSGERLSFERVYFERRRLLGRAALAVLLSENVARERMLRDLLEKLRDIAGEASWALPAHVEAPSGKDSRVLDLFAAETANLMAEMLVVFDAAIPAELAGRIRERLRREVFEAYVEHHRELRWFRAGMNWNAVCHQGIVGAALLIERDTVLLARMLRLAAEGLPHFIRGFGDDGSTSEGPGYWQYGFGWFVELNAQVEARTEGRLSLMSGDAKIARIAHFAPHLTLRNGYWINFSDGERRGTLRASLLAYLAVRLQSATLSARAAEAYQRVAREGMDFDEQRADFFYLSRLILRCPDRLDEEHKVSKTDGFFPHYGAVVVRGEDARGRYWEFAAKAGNNAEHHNHNDCGSFILHVDGVPIAIEIGAPEYVREYFREERYSFLAARSAGHSVPLVNGYEQAAGAEFAATVIKCETTDHVVEFVMDLARCYPAAACCRRLVRTLRFEKQQGQLTVTDTAEFDGEGVLESLLISEAPITVLSGGINLETAAGRLTVALSGTPVSARVDSPEYRNRQGGVASINRLRLVTAAPAKVVSVGFSIAAADHSRVISSQ